MKQNIKANLLFNQAYELAYGNSERSKRPWKGIFSTWSESAALGHKRSMFYVGTCYDFGLGVKKDLKKAFEFYLKAAKLGHRDSQYNVGCFYSIRLQLL